MSAINLCFNWQALATSQLASQILFKQSNTNSLPPSQIHCFGLSSSCRIQSVISKLEFSDLHIVTNFGFEVCSQLASFLPVSFLPMQHGYWCQCFFISTILVTTSGLPEATTKLVSQCMIHPKYSTHTLSNKLDNMIILRFLHGGILHFSKTCFLGTGSHVTV